MALNFICKNRHSYLAPDLPDPDLEYSGCPICFAEELRERDPDDPRIEKLMKYNMRPSDKLQKLPYLREERQ